QAVASAVTSKPRNFGYDEATRRFRLPPSSGRPELNVYASRSTIDTGIETLSEEVVYNAPGVRQVSRQDVQQDITINEAIGSGLSEPLGISGGVISTLSGGLDYKWRS